MSDSPGSAARPKLAVELLEDRTVPTFLPRTGLPNSIINDQPFPPFGQGGLSIAIGNVIPEPPPSPTQPAPAVNEYVLGTGPGVIGTVSVYSTSGQLLRQFVPFGAFTGGLNVAVGDVTGDTRPEIIVSVARAGPPVVGVFTGDGVPLKFFFAFPPFYTGGVNVAVGNVMPTGGQSVAAGAPGASGAKSEIIVGTAASASLVQIFDGNAVLQRSFFAFPGFTGGVTLAAASIENTRSASTGPDINAYAEIIVGAASVLPAVTIFSALPTTPSRLQIYFAFDPSIPANRTGVTVAAGSTDGLGQGFLGAEIYVALTNGSRIRGFRGDTGVAFADFNAFPAGYSRVVNMAIGNITTPLFTAGPADLAIVAGDGPFFQIPRLFFGALASPAGLNGP